MDRPAVYFERASSFLICWVTLPSENDTETARHHHSSFAEVGVAFDVTFFGFPSV